MRKWGSHRQLLFNTCWLVIHFIHCPPHSDQACLWRTISCICRSKTCAKMFPYSPAWRTYFQTYIGSCKFTSQTIHCSESNLVSHFPLPLPFAWPTVSTLNRIENFVYTMAKFNLSSCTIMVCVSDPKCMRLCAESSFPCYDYQFSAFHPVRIADHRLMNCLLCGAHLPYHMPRLHVNFLCRARSCLLRWSK